ncbi:MAG TPA: phosphoserine phosphatase SerB [Paenalcaligenes sp.]|nr:phosphoserine phosphatase SerB [Paenalcaligenes sp.]
MTHLILQSPTLLDSLAVEKIAALSAGSGVQELGPTIARVLQADRGAEAEIKALCAQYRLDFAYLDEIHNLRDCKLLAMDMDSTLINIECIDEIAAVAGRKDEVAQITEAAMRGEITDFSESLRRRVAMLEGVPQEALEQVYEQRLSLNAGAQELVAKARQNGIYTLLVSGGFTFYTERLKQRLQLDETHANTLEVRDGKLTGRVLGDIVDGAAKADHVARLAQELGARPEQIIVMGDGANDLPMMAHSYYSVAYRAKPVVQEQARFALNYCALDAALNWFRT